MRGHSAGFTLFEILVTVFVLSIGLLGIAALQGVSKHANFEAVQRTTATLLAQDIIERMRANPSGLASYLGADLGGATITDEPTPACTSISACTPQELALHDRWEWERAIDGAAEMRAAVKAGGLVLPTACISGPVGGGAGTYTIAIAWRGQTALSDPTTSACGQDSGTYGDADEFRRVLVIDTYILN